MNAKAVNVSVARPTAADSVAANVKRAPVQWRRIVKKGHGRRREVAAVTGVDAVKRKSLVSMCGECRIADLYLPTFSFFHFLFIV